jgi:type VI protein secretion system component VasF
MTVKMKMNGEQKVLQLIKIRQEADAVLRNSLKVIQELRSNKSPKSVKKTSVSSNGKRVTATICVIWLALLALAALFVLSYLKTGDL